MSADRATGQQQTTIGRFTSPDAAGEEMRQKQAENPHRAFYCFLHISEKTRLLVGHTL